MRVVPTALSGNAAVLLRPRGRSLMPI